MKSNKFNETSKMNKIEGRSRNHANKIKNAVNSFTIYKHFVVCYRDIANRTIFL